MNALDDLLKLCSRCCQIQEPSLAHEGCLSELGSCSVDNQGSWQAPPLMVRSLPMGKHPCSSYCTCEHPCVKPQACRTAAFSAGLIRAMLHTRKQKDSTDGARQLPRPV